MAHQFASQQPAGFKNRIENVAIVGAGGRAGSEAAKALLRTGKHTVTALTREDSTSQLPAGLIVKKINYDNVATIVDALRGQDCFIITMGVTAPPEQQMKLIDAAAEAGVPWVLPNEWGGDQTQEQMGKDTLLAEGSKKHRQHIEKLGVSSWIGICCGFWYEWSLSGGLMMYGIDAHDRKARFYDDGNTRINTSTWPQVGRAVASLLSLRILPEHANDRSLTLNEFRDGWCYIDSFCINQREMLDSVMRVTGTGPEDWTITSEPSKDVWEEGQAAMKNGDRLGFARQLYSRVFFPNGDGNFGARHGLHNNLLGLPQDDLDEYTKVALQYNNPIMAMLKSH